MDANSPFQPLPDNASMYGEPTLVETGLGPAYQYMTGYDSEGSGIYEYGAVPASAYGPYTSGASPSAFNSNAPSINISSYTTPTSSPVTNFSPVTTSSPVGGLSTLASTPATTSATTQAAGRIDTSDYEGDVYKWLSTNGAGMDFSSLSPQAQKTITNLANANNQSIYGSTTAGTSIVGPSATVVGDAMYTSDGKVITNPIVSDYQRYGLAAPKNTPTVSPRGNPNPFFNNGLTPGVRNESLYTGAVTPTSTDPLGLIYNTQSPVNPYAAFGTGQDVSKAYVTASGDIILPGGQIVKNPAVADYEQYGVGISKALNKGSLTSDESIVANTIKSAKDSAIELIKEQARTQGLSSRDTNDLIQTVTDRFDREYNDFIRAANLPGVQGYKNYYTYTPEQIAAQVPEDQRIHRLTAEEVWNGLTPDEQKETSLKIIQTNIDNFRKSDKPEDRAKVDIPIDANFIRNLANEGKINLGTKLVGWDYDKLGVTDPEQLKALTAAGNKYGMGLNMLNDWGLLQRSSKGKTSYGFNIQTGAALAEAIADGKITADELHQYLPKSSGRAIKQLTEFAQDMQALRGDTAISLSDLRRITPGGTDPKLINPDLKRYAVTSVDYKKGNHYILVDKVGDDQYRVVGGNKAFTPVGGGGFWNWAPKIAGLALAVFAPQLGASIGSALLPSASSFTQAVVGNMALGGVKAGLTGGNVGMGILTGGAGAAVGNLVNNALMPDTSWSPTLLRSGGFDPGSFSSLSISNPQLVNAISQTAGNAASNIVAGANPLDTLKGGLINLGGNVANVAVGDTARSVLPNLSTNQNKILSGGLTALALAPYTKANPTFIGGGVLGQLAYPYLRGLIKK